MVDFEGIKVLESDGTWGQMAGSLIKRRRIVNNALKHVGKTDEDTWWGVDYSKDCGIRRMKIGSLSLFGVLRFDGDRKILVVVTQRGFVEPSCGQVDSPNLFPQMNTEESRAWGDWIATSEALYYEGQTVDS